MGSRSFPRGAAARALWGFEPTMTYLNHGAFGAVPRVVRAAQQRWLRRIDRQPCSFFIREQAGELRAAAGEMAAEVGAAEEDLAFVENATRAVSDVLHSLTWEQGDEILVFDHGYPAVARAVDFLRARHGLRKVVASLPFPCPGPEIVTQRFAAALGPRTKLAIVDHITSPTALVLPIGELIATCRRRGVAVLVDGAHALGQLPLDLPALDADWYTGNCHKWLFAPRGAAILWANPADRRGRRSGLHPSAISHHYPQGFPLEFDWTGTRDFSAWLATRDGLAFHRRLGGDALRRDNHDLVLRGSELLAEAWGTTPGGPPSMTGALRALRLPGEPEGDARDADALMTRLWREHRIEVPIFPVHGHLVLRISAQAYNELADYEQLAEAALTVLRG